MIITAARKKIGVGKAACVPLVLDLAHGVFKNRFAVAAQHHAARMNCIIASSMIPASFDSVKYRDTAATAP
ncbi:hypothetical protein CGSMWGv0288E_06670 [Gardnerella vaginalis 0288E]|nr:hypothetical protein CGSMWGv0288E_06670 [Gardnerella vaginalis 0288E]EIK76451.1 hypothetical protein CGSMWGv284V_01109 [Gardnerella vaginalis 284V]